MSHMTKIRSVPNRDDVRPGMAYFARTGPPNKTCHDCALLGYIREVLSEHSDGRTVWRRVHNAGCLGFKQFAGHDGPVV